MTKKSAKAILGTNANEKLEKAIGYLQLNSIFLKSSSSDCITGPGATESGGINIVTRTTHSRSLSSDKRLFVCFVTMNLQGLRGGDLQFEVEACFALAYEILSPESVTDDVLELFSKKNAVYNAYPYFREFFQNAMVRMGLPPLQLPLLKPLTKAQIEAASMG